jgi:multisubunit Na+/H+ antiporter MnhB subunit
MTRFTLTAVGALLIVGVLFAALYVTGAAIGVAVIGLLILAAIVGAIYLSLRRPWRSSRSR